MRVWQLCQNAIQNQLLKSMLILVGTVAVNYTIPGCDDQLHLDVVVSDEGSKKILIVDVTILFNT